MSWSPHRVRIFFSPTQYIRIFVIVNLTTYLVTKAFLDSRSSADRAGRRKSDEQQRSKKRVVKYQAQRENTQSVVKSRQGRDTVETMAPRGKGENTKKVAGNAKKADAAAAKAAASERAAEAEEENKWSQGAKGANAKKQAEAEKKAEAAAKKAERDKLLAEEEKLQRDKPKGAGKKTAEKKSRGTLNLDDLEGSESGSGSTGVKTLNASGIDNALDALSLANSDGKDLKMDRHPERRFKAAYKAYEDRRLPEIELEHPGLRKNQRVEIVRKEFEKSEENPFNQVGNVRFDSTREEVEEQKRKVKEGVEQRLGEK